MGRSRIATAVCVLTITAAVLQESALAAAPTCMGEKATIVGTSQSEELRGTAGDDVIVARGGDDFIDARGGHDVVCGNSCADVLFGKSGNDRLNAGTGWGDTVAGGPGNDELNGGPGHFDDANFRSATQGVTANLMTSTATGEGTDSLAGVDQVVGSDFDDVITGDDDVFGNPGLLGLDGNDTISAGDGEFDAIVPGHGDDTIDGGPGFDYVDHIVDGYIGEAADAVVVDLPAGTITGQGNDQVVNVEGASGTRGDDTMIGDAADNEFSSLVDGNDVVDSGPGDDKIQPGVGDDEIDGGPGTDELWFFFHDHPVTVNLEAGTAAGEGQDTVAGIEDIIGTDLADTLIGNGDANRLDGGRGADALTGGDGNDVLIGSGGNDAADGGEGTDQCAAENEIDCEAEPPPELWR